MFRCGIVRSRAATAVGVSSCGLFAPTQVFLAPKAKKKPEGAPLKARAKSPVASVDSLLDQKSPKASPSANIVAQILGKKGKPVAAPQQPKATKLPVAKPKAVPKAAPKATLIQQQPPAAQVQVPAPAQPIAPVASPATATKKVKSAPAAGSEPKTGCPSPAAPHDPASDSKELALDIFKKMLNLMTNLGETYKVKAYAQTVAILSKYPGPITASHLVIPGLGAKSAVKLREICTTGKLQELEDLIKSGAADKKVDTPVSPAKSVKAPTPAISVHAPSGGAGDKHVLPANLKSGPILTNDDGQDSKALAIKIFEEMHQAMKATSDPFKSKAYAQAVEALKKFDGPVYSSTYIPGLGGKTVGKLKEICMTGRLAELDDLKATNPSFGAITELCKVNGVGPATAKKWYTMGIDSIEKLRQNADRVGLHESQKMGLKYFDDCLLRIPYAECRTHNAFLQRAAATVFRGEVPEAQHVPLSATGEDVLAEDDPQCSVKIVICGSHRRGRASSGDVDCLMTYSDSFMEQYGGQTNASSLDEDASGGRINRLADYLRKEGYLVDAISSGNTKMMAYVRLPGSPPEFKNAEAGKSNKKPPYPVRRLDIRWVPRKSFAPALLYFTGSADFNGRMRSWALSQGYTLNEYGLFKLPTDPKTGMPDLNKEVVRLASRNPKNAVGGLETEEDIFKAVNFEYVNPAEREK